MREPGSMCASLDVALEADEAFATLIDELASALRRHGMHVEARANGRVLDGQTEVGRVVAWEDGVHATMEWRPASWQTDGVAAIELRVAPLDRGARLTIELRGLEPLVGSAGEMVGWFASEVGAAVLSALAPQRFGDWITDRQARRPWGAQARGIYRDPLFHYPNFRVILDELALQPQDYLLEIGCGGGAFLQLALESGCRAAAVDYSADMIRVARATNADAIAAGRLEIAEADAAALPFPDERFTCAVMTGVLGFLPHPIAGLAELRRVLRPGGRVVLLGSDPEARGTPAAPEPMASRLRFYDDAQLEELGRAAGFTSVRAVQRDLEPHARAVGVPEEIVPLFAGVTRFLLARKD